MALPGQAAYAASKHAVVGFTDALRREMHPFGVTVVSIEPVRTTHISPWLSHRPSRPEGALRASIMGPGCPGTGHDEDTDCGRLACWPPASSRLGGSVVHCSRHDVRTPEADQSTLAPPHPASRPFPAAASDEAKRAYGPTFVDDFMKATATFVNSDLHDPIKVILVRWQRRNRVPGHGRARTH